MLFTDSQRTEKIYTGLKNNNNRLEEGSWMPEVSFVNIITQAIGLLNEIFSQPKKVLIDQLIFNSLNN